MPLVRTNITLPAETLAIIDEVADPRGRSAYIAGVLLKQAKRDRMKKVWEENRGVLKGSTTWGTTPEEVLETLKEIRASWDRPHVDALWGRLLDTTLLIDHSIDLPGAVATVRRLFEEADDLIVCDAVVAEALSSGTPAERRAIANLIDAVEYVATDPDAAKWAGEARRIGGAASPRHLGDALIAGVAWSLGATVVTRNPDDFVRMGVPVLAYEADAPG